MTDDSALAAYLARVDHLETLRPNWDSYGGDPIQPGVGDRARSILGALAQRASVAATGDGGITIEFDHVGDCVEIEVRPNGQVSILIDDRELTF